MSHAELKIIKLIYVGRDSTTRVPLDLGPKVASTSSQAGSSPVKIKCIRCRCGVEKGTPFSTDVNKQINVFTFQLRRV